ncbi:integrase domain-containing protein [Xenorhabdus sp. BG5]|uniref:integrase domain-containing protein n=1 Tax=Xenorhabdus sp. BG5 TaxID=2782014 RepID=UPI001881F8E3|nr:integrase domain-containing protein [Xenorhabdus sp. BG5]MBE8597412.1 integrase domain-containing protein [Xenorhabdus sp. BG5]
MSRLMKELKFFARQGGGSYKTCHDRIRIARRLGALLLSLNIQVKSLSHLKTKHVEQYVDARLSQGIAKRTVQCSASLKSWRKQLEQPEPKLHVVFGTKGGRPRQTRVLDIAAVKVAVEQAIIIAEQRNGRLIDKLDLKQAMNYWRTHTTRIGLTGRYSPHSLRYAWAQDALRFYQQNGFSHQEARALVAMDLGHGDGRGRYVERVYSR